MKGFFVTGTDTEIGKTLVSAILTLALDGYYWKPVQSSLIEGTSDDQTVKRLTGLPDERIFESTYALQESLSPNQAARLEGVTVDLQACRLENPRYPLIVEGAGGVMVPVNDTHCMLDLINLVNLPAVIVSRGTLGTINHTLLTIETLRLRNVVIHGIIFSGDLNPDNQRDIEHWSGVKTLFHVPRLENISKATLHAWVMPRLQQIREKFHDVELTR